MKSNHIQLELLKVPRSVRQFSPQTCELFRLMMIEIRKNLKSSQHMNSAKFTWEKYHSNGVHSIPEAWDFHLNKPRPEYEEVGRCPASSLVVRPRSEGEAIMVRHRESGEEFWFHGFPEYAIPKTT